MKYAVLGNYGATNLGDEAILEAIIDHIKENDAEADITVLSYNPEQTSLIHKVKSVYLFPAGFRSFFRSLFNLNILKTISVLRKTDKLYFGGGGLFSENYNAILLWFWQIFLCHFFCKFIIFFRQGIDRPTSFFFVYLLKKALSYATFVSVRDEISAKIIRFLGCENVKVERDPVLEWKWLRDYINSSLKTAYSEGENAEILNTEKSYVVLSLRNHIYHDAVFSSMLSEILSNYAKMYNYEIVFLPMQFYGEDEDLKFYEIYRKKIAKDVPCHLFEFNFQRNFKEELKRLINLLIKAEGVISMRLHALIFAFLCKHDAIAISGSRKIKTFAENAKFTYVNVSDIHNLSKILLS